MMKCVRIFIFILMFMYAEGIKCFQCSSLRDQGCAELGAMYGASPGTTTALNASVDALKYYKECEDNYGDREPFCRKMFQTIYAREKMEVVTRSCGWEMHPRLQCYDFENKGHSETVCQCFEDGCNSAVLTRSAVIATSFVSFILLLV